MSTGRFFSVCIIVITILCVNIVSSDVRMKATRLGINRGFSRQLPLKSGPKLSSAGISARHASHTSVVKPRSFWSSLFGKSGKTVAAAPLAGAAYVASRSKHGRSNKTASVAGFRESLRVKRDDHEENRVENRRNQVGHPENEENRQQNHDDHRADQDWTTSAPEKSTMATTISGILQKLTTKAKFLTTAASRLLSGSSTVSIGNQMEYTVNAVNISPTFPSKDSGRDQQMTFADNKITTTESSAIKTFSATTKSVVAVSTTKMTSTDEDRKEGKTPTTNTIGQSGSPSGNFMSSGTIAPEKVATSGMTAAPGSITTVSSKAASFGSGQSATPVAPNLSLNGISGSSTLGKLIDGVTTMAPQTDATIAKNNATSQSSVVASRTTVAPQTNATTSRSNVSQLTNTTTIGNNVASLMNATTPKSLVAPQTSIIASRTTVAPQTNTTASNAAPLANTTTTRSNVTPLANTTTTRSNVAPLANTTTTRSNVSPSIKLTTPKSNTAQMTNMTTIRATVASQANMTASNAAPLANTITTRSNVSPGINLTTPKSNTAQMTNVTTIRATVASQTNTTASNAAPLANTTTTRSNVAPLANTTTTRSNVSPGINLTTPKSHATQMPSAGNVTLNGVNGSSTANSGGNSSKNVTLEKPTILACPVDQVFCLRQWSCVVSNEYYDLETMRWSKWLADFKDGVICDQNNVCQSSYCQTKVCKSDEIYSLKTESCVKYSSIDSEYHTEFPEFPHTTESPIHHSSNASHACPKGEVYTLPVDVFCRVDKDCLLESKCCYVSESVRNKLPSCVWIAENTTCPSFMSYCSTTSKCHLPTEACNETCRMPWTFCSSSNSCVEAGTCQPINSSLPLNFKPFELPKELSPDFKIKSLLPVMEDCDSQRLVSDMFEMQGLVDFPLKVKEKLLLRFLRERPSWTVDHVEYYDWITAFSAVLSVKESSVEIRSSETANKALTFIPTAEFPCSDGMLVRTARNINGNNGDFRWSSIRCENSRLRMKFYNTVRFQCRPNYYGKVTLHMSPLVVDVNGNKTYGKTQDMDIEVLPVHDPPTLRLGLADVDVEIPFVTAVPIALDPSRDEGTLVKDFTASYFHSPDGEDLGMGVIAAQDSDLGFWEFKLPDSGWMNITDVDPSCLTFQKLGITDIHQGAVFLDGAVQSDGKTRSRRSLIFFNDTVNATPSTGVSAEHPFSKKSQAEFQPLYSKDFRAFAEYKVPMSEDPENATEYDELFNITQFNELSLKNPWRQRHRFASLPLDCQAQHVLDESPAKANVSLTTSATSITLGPAIGSTVKPERQPMLAPLTLTTTSKSGLTTTISLSSSTIASWSSAATTKSSGAGSLQSSIINSGMTTNSASTKYANAATTKSSGTGISGTLNPVTVATSANSGTSKSANSTSSPFADLSATKSASSSAPNSAITKTSPATAKYANSSSTNLPFSAAKNETVLTTTKSANSATTTPSANHPSTVSENSTTTVNPAKDVASTKASTSKSSDSLSTANSANSTISPMSLNPTVTTVSYPGKSSTAHGATSGSASTKTTAAVVVGRDSSILAMSTTASSKLATGRDATITTTTTGRAATIATTTTATGRNATTAATKSASSPTSIANASNAASGTTAKTSDSARTVSALESSPTTAVPSKDLFWHDDDEVISKEVKLVTQILYLPPTARLRFVRRNSTQGRWWSILSAMKGSKLAFLAWDGSDGKKAGSREQVSATLCTVQDEECAPDVNSSLSSHVAVVRRRPLDCYSQSSLLVPRVPDECGICGGDGRACLDCNGTANGDAVMDCSDCVGGSTGEALYGGRDCGFQCSKTSAVKFGSSCFGNKETNFQRCDQKSNTSFIDECGHCSVAQNTSLNKAAESTVCGQCEGTALTTWLKTHQFSYFNCDDTWKKDLMVEAVAFGPHPHLSWIKSPEFGQAAYADLAAFSGPVLLLHVYGPSWSYKKDTFSSVACDLVDFAGIVVSPLKSALMADRLQIELRAVEMGNYRISCRVMTPNKDYYTLTPFSKLTVVDSRRVWVQSCTPSTIKAKRKETLSILGEGFVNSTDLTCFVFVHPSKVAKTLSKANFVSEGKVTCNVSESWLEKSTIIDVGVALSSLALGQYNARRFPLLSTVTVEARGEELVHLVSVYISNDWRAVIANFDCIVQFENCFNIFSNMTDIFGKNVSCKAKDDAITVYPNADLNGLVGKNLRVSETNDVSCVLAPKAGIPGATGNAVVQKPENEIPLAFVLIGPSQVCLGNASFQVVALSGTGGKPVTTRWKISAGSNDSASAKGKESFDSLDFPPSALNVTIPSKILSAGIRYVVEVTVTNVLKSELSRATEFTVMATCEASLSIVGPAIVNPQHDVFLTALVSLSSAYPVQPLLTFYWQISGSYLNINNVRSNTVMIEKGSLEGGMTYFVQCLVIINGDPTKTAVSSFNLSTSLGNPVALTSVSMLEVPVTKGFWLDGELSHDPYKPSKNLRFLWTCSSERYGGCFSVTNSMVRRLEAILNSTMQHPSLMVDGNLLAVGKYHFQLMVLTSDGRQAKTSVFVNIVPLRNAPAITITQSGKTAVRPGGEITLRSFISAPAGTTLLWQCAEVRGNGYFSISTSPSTGSYHLVESDVEDVPFTTTLRSSDDPAGPWWTRLLPDTRYMFTLTASHPIEGTIRAYVTVKTVSSPAVRTISVNPVSGVAIFTAFSIDVSEFWSDEIVSILHIGFRETAQNDTSIRYLRQVTRTIPLIEDIRLPAAAVTSANLIVVVKACSSDDVCSLSKSSPVEVKMPDLSTKDRLSAVLDTVTAIVNQGDLASAVAHATSCIHTLHVAGYRSGATFSRLVRMTDLLVRQRAARIEISFDSSISSTREEAFDILSAACDAFKDVRPSTYTVITLVALQSKMMDAYVHQQVDIDEPPTSQAPPDLPTRIPYGTSAIPVTNRVDGYAGLNGTTVSLNSSSVTPAVSSERTISASSASSRTVGGTGHTTAGGTTTTPSSSSGGASARTLTNTPDNTSSRTYPRGTGTTLTGASVSGLVTISTRGAETTRASGTETTRASGTETTRASGTETNSFRGSGTTSAASGASSSRVTEVTTAVPSHGLATKPTLQPSASTMKTANYTDNAVSEAPTNGSANKAMALETGPEASIPVGSLDEFDERMHSGYVMEMVDGLKRLFRFGRSARRSGPPSRNSGSGGSSISLGSKGSGSTSGSKQSSASSNQQAAKPAKSETNLKTTENKVASPGTGAKQPDKNAKVSSEINGVKPEAKAVEPEINTKKLENKVQNQENKVEKQKKKIEKQEKKVEKLEKKKEKKSQKEVEEYEKQAKKYENKADKYEKKAEKSKKKAEEARKKAEKVKEKSKDGQTISSDLDIRHAANRPMLRAYNPGTQNYGWQQRMPHGLSVFVVPGNSRRRYRYPRSPTRPSLSPVKGPPAQNLPPSGDASGNAYLVSESNQPISGQQAETLLAITDLALAAGSTSPATLYQQLLGDLPELWMAMCLDVAPASRPVTAVSKALVLQVAKVDVEKAIAEDGNYPFVDVANAARGFVRTSSYFHLVVGSKMNAADFDCSGGESDCGTVCFGSAHFSKDPLIAALGLETNNPTAGLARGDVVALLPVFYADSQEISLLDVVDSIGLNMSVDAEDVAEAEIPYLKCAAWSNDYFSWNTGLCNTSNIFRGPKAIRVSCTCSPTGFFGLHLDRAQIPVKSVAETTTTTTTPVTPRTNPPTATTRTSADANTTISANATTQTSGTSTPPLSPPSALTKAFKLGFAIDGDFDKIVINRENFTFLMTTQLAALLNITANTFSAVTLDPGSVKVTMVVTPDPNSQYGNGTELMELIHQMISDEIFCFKGENNETLCARKNSDSITAVKNEPPFQRQQMVGMIVGIIFGVVVGIVALCILYTVIRNRMKKNKIAATEASMAAATQSSVNYKNLKTAPNIPQAYAPLDGTIDSREQYRMKFAPTPNEVPNSDGSWNYPSPPPAGDPNDDYLRPASRISTVVHQGDPVPPPSGGPSSVSPANPNPANLNPPTGTAQHDKPPSTLVNAAPAGKPEKPDQAPQQRSQPPRRGPPQPPKGSKR